MEQKIVINQQNKLNEPKTELKSQNEKKMYKIINIQKISSKINKKN